jgi:mono/diheme cytochrome c family protein
MRSFSFGFICVFCFAALATSARADKIERTWQAKCGSCHGDDGKAQTAKGKEMGIRDLTSAAWQKELTDEKMQKAIEDGVDTTKDGKKQQMDAYKDKLKPEQITELVKYMRSLASK